MENDGDKNLRPGPDREDSVSELVGGTSVDIKPANVVDTSYRDTEKAETKPGVLKLLSDETGADLKKTLGMFVPESEKRDENIYFQFMVFLSGREFSDFLPDSLNISIKENYVLLVLNFLGSKNRDIVSPGVLSSPEFKSVLTEQILKSFNFFTERALDPSEKNKATADYLTKAITWINRSYQAFVKNVEADSGKNVQDDSIEKPEEV